MDSDSEHEVHNVLDVSCDLFDDSDQMKPIPLRDNNIHALDTSVLDNNFSVKAAYSVTEKGTKHVNEITQDSGQRQFTQFNKELRESALIKKGGFIRSQDDIPGKSEEWSENSYLEGLLNSDEQSSLDESIQGLPSKRHKFISTDNVYIASSTSDILKMTEEVHDLRSTPAKNHFGSINSEIPLNVSSKFPIQVSPKPWNDDLDTLSKTAQTHLSQINLKNDGADFFYANPVYRHLKLSENKNSCNENEPKDASPNNGGTSLPFVCPFCNLSETDIHFLEEHIEAMHPVNMSGELGGTGAGHNAIFEGAKAMSNVEDAVFLYVCPLCDMDLGDETTLHLHLNTLHEEESQMRESSTINCPLCEVGCLSEQEMKIHMKNHSSDDTKYCVSTNEMDIESGTCSMMCPVCQLEMDDADLLTSHVESHFNPQHSAETSLSYDREINNAEKHVTDSSVNRKQKKDTSVSSTSVDIANSSKVKQFKSDTKESCSSNAINLNKKTVWPSQWNQSVTSAASEERFIKTSSKVSLPPSSSRENGSYKKQYEQNLERAVVRGEISAAEFHEEMRKLSHQVVKGVDDGSTRIQGLIEKMEAMYRSQARPGQSVLLCSPTDHFSGSLGDKGWGCGYRNFQMILSCLAKLDNYAQRIFKDEQRLIPSIPKIQQMIESAWQQGFDPQGCSQLNGRLCNTRKWIGATEIVAVLSSLGIKCQLVDFHSPSAPDGTHPRLLEWVKEYFKKFHYQPTAPLYLQHQGHSRTIVGVENDKGTVKLLLFDPGTPKDQIAAQVKGQISWKDMRLFRRTQAGFKARQYQIVAIVGILTEQEYQESKILKSERIS